MDFSMVFEGRVDSKSDGNANIYMLPTQGGGRRVKVLQVMVEILQSSGTEFQVKADLDQGPNGETWTLHSNPIPLTAAPAILPAVLAGDADDSKIIGEYMRVQLHADSSDANGQWGYVKVYVLRKPF